MGFNGMKDTSGDDFGECAGLRIHGCDPYGVGRDIIIILTRGL